MHRHLLALSCAISFSVVAHADEATDLRDRALKSFVKDPASLQKLKVYTVKAKGTARVGLEPSPATYELTAVWPSQARFSWEFGTGPSKTTITIVGADDRAWRKVGDMKAVDLTFEESNDFRADAYATWVATLSTLTDADSKLTFAGASKVNGEPVTGLKISRRSWPEITLYFDGKTGLLRKMAYKAREAGVTLNKELIYDGHKEVSGLMLPTKQTTIIHNREVFTWTDMEYSFPEKIEPKVFEKP